MGIMFSNILVGGIGVILGTTFGSIVGSKVCNSIVCEPQVVYPFLVICFIVSRILNKLYPPGATNVGENWGIAHLCIFMDLFSVFAVFVYSIAYLIKRVKK